MRAGIILIYRGGNWPREVGRFVQGCSAAWASPGISSSGVGLTLAISPRPCPFVLCSLRENPCSGTSSSDASHLCLCSVFLAARLLLENSAFIQRLFLLHGNRPPQRAELLRDDVSVSICAWPRFPPSQSALHPHRNCSALRVLLPEGVLL